MAYEDWDEKSKVRQKEVEEEQACDAMELYKDLGNDSPKSTDTPKNNTQDNEESNFNFISNSLTPKMQTIVSLPFSISNIFENVGLLTVCIDCTSKAFPFELAFVIVRWPLPRLMCY